MVGISYFLEIANPTNETQNSLKLKNARFKVCYLKGLIVSIDLTEWSNGLFCLL